MINMERSRRTRKASSLAIAAEVSAAAEMAILNKTTPTKKQQAAASSPAASTRRKTSAATPSTTQRKRKSAPVAPAAFKSNARKKPAVPKAKKKVQPIIVEESDEESEEEASHCGWTPCMVMKREEELKRKEAEAEAAGQRGKRKRKEGDGNMEEEEEGGEGDDDRDEKEKEDGDGEADEKEAGDLWIGCDICNTWYHSCCVGMEEFEEMLIAEYHCPICVKAFGESIMKPNVNDNRYNFGEKSEIGKRTQIGTRGWMREFVTKEMDIPQMGDWLDELGVGEDLSYLIERTGWTKPILIKDSTRIEMTVPPRPYGITDIMNVLGYDRKMEVIDVYAQKSLKMSLGKFHDTWMAPRPVTTGRIYNVISLEFSKSKLTDAIRAPRAIRELSWVERWWMQPAHASAESTANSNSNNHYRDQQRHRQRQQQRFYGNVSNSPSATILCDGSPSTAEISTFPSTSTAAAASSTAAAAASTSASHLLLPPGPGNYRRGRPARTSILSTVSSSMRTISSSGSHSSYRQQQDDCFSFMEFHAEHEKLKPQVLYFCLMGMAGSFTDWHIDFGGSSVWYNIYWGKKIFYMIEPSHKNLEIYQKWFKDEKRSEVWLADLVDDHRRIEINPGETLMIPSGWIHAVYTPVDSLVFGGNIIDSLHIPMQLKIYEMEEDAKTNIRFMFPSFELCSWYALQEIHNDLKNANECNLRVNRRILEGGQALLSTLTIWLERDKKRYLSAAKSGGLNYTKWLKDLETELKIQETMPMGTKGISFNLGGIPIAGLAAAATNNGGSKPGIGRGQQQRRQQSGRGRGGRGGGGRPKHTIDTGPNTMVLVGGGGSAVPSIFGPTPLQAALLLQQQAAAVAQQAAQAAYGASQIGQLVGALNAAQTYKTAVAAAMGGTDGTGLNRSAEQAQVEMKKQKKMNSLRVKLVNKDPTGGGVAQFVAQPSGTMTSSPTAGLLPDSNVSGDVQDGRGKKGRQQRGRKQKKPTKIIKTNNNIAAMTSSESTTTMKEEQPPQNEDDIKSPQIRQQPASIKLKLSLSTGSVDVSSVLAARPKKFYGRDKDDDVDNADRNEDDDNDDDDDGRLTPPHMRGAATASSVPSRIKEESQQDDDDGSSPASCKLLLQPASSSAADNSSRSAAVSKNNLNTAKTAAAAATLPQLSPSPVSETDAMETSAATAAISCLREDGDDDDDDGETFLGGRPLNLSNKTPLVGFSLMDIKKGTLRDSVDDDDDDGVYDSKSQNNGKSVLNAKTIKATSSKSTVKRESSPETSASSKVTPIKVSRESGGISGSIDISGIFGTSSHGRVQKPSKWVKDAKNGSSDDFVYSTKIPMNESPTKWKTSIAASSSTSSSSEIIIAGDTEQKPINNVDDDVDDKHDHLLIINEKGKGRPAPPLPIINNNSNMKTSTKPSNNNNISLLSMATSAKSASTTSQLSAAAAAAAGGAGVGSGGNPLASNHHHTSHHHVQPGPGINTSTDKLKKTSNNGNTVKQRLANKLKISRFR